MVPSHTYEPFRPCWMVTFEALAECHDILILGKSLIKWRQRPDMTLVVDCDVKHQRKQILIVKFTIFKVLVPVLSVHPSYHKYWSLLYRYLPYTPSSTINSLSYITSTGPCIKSACPCTTASSTISQVLVLAPVIPLTSLTSQSLVPFLPVHPLYHHISPKLILLVPVIPVHPLRHKHWSLSYRYIPYITSTGPCPTITSHTHGYISQL